MKLTPMKELNIKVTRKDKMIKSNQKTWTVELIGGTAYVILKVKRQKIALIKIDDLVFTNINKYMENYNETK